MQAFFQFLQTAMNCGTALCLALLVLLALPQSRLRSVLVECARRGGEARSVFRARRVQPQLQECVDEP